MRQQSKRTEPGNPIFRTITLCFWVLFTLAPPIHVTAQPARIDSLVSELKGKNGTSRVDLMLVLTEELLHFSPQKGLVYGHTILNSGDIGDDHQRRVKTYIQLGKLHGRLGQFDSADFFLNKATTLSSENVYKEGLASSHYFQGDVDYVRGHFGSALEHYQQALSIYQEVEDKVGEAISLSGIASIYGERGELQQSLTYSKQALAIYETVGNKKNQLIVYNDLGVTYDDMGNLPLALEYYFKALHLAEQMDDKLVQASISNNIGSLYDALENNDDALKFYKNALNMVKNIGDRRVESYLLHNIGVIYTKEKLYDQAKDFLSRALTIRTELELTCDITHTQAALGFLYKKSNQFDAANKLLRLSLDKAKSCQYPGLQSTINVDLGDIYYSQGRFNDALAAYQKGYDIASQSGLIKELKNAAYGLYKAYKEQKRYNTSLQYHEEYQTLGDSLFNTTNSEKLTRLEMEYDFEKERNELEHQQEVQALSFRVAMQKRKFQQGATIVGLVVLAILAGAYGRLYYVKRRSNNQLIQLNNEIGAQKEEIMQQRDQLADKNQGLMDLNQEKNTLIGVVAHDLRSPLNQIKGLISLIRLESNTLNQNSQEYLQHVFDSSDRMTNMIARILDVNAIETKQVNIKPEIADVAEVMEYVASNFNKDIKEKNLTVDTALAKGIHFALVDRNYLIQVFENIMSNAIKFSTAGKRIYLTISNEKQHVRISVRDEGPGISPEDMKRLFGRFQQLTAKPTAGESTTGLGLSIAKKYIEAMGGTIICESKVGQGADFIIKFPLVESTAEV
ncbi:MAG: tetratricopeptide repeat protein [Bacteroidota bacterium]